MSQTLPIPPGFDELSIDEQIEYLQSLWDRIAAKPEAVPVPDWHKEILAKRLASESDTKSWEELEEELRKDRKAKS